MKRMEEMITILSELVEDLRSHYEVSGGGKNWFVKLESQSVKGLEQELVLTLVELGFVMFNMKVKAPPVTAERAEYVDHFLQEWKQKCTFLKVFSLDDRGEIFVMGGVPLSDLSKAPGGVSVLRAYVDRMAQEVDANYMDLIHAIVPPVKNPRDHYAMFSFMKRIILSPKEKINLHKENTSWGIDRFEGRLVGFSWALLDERKPENLDMVTATDRRGLLEAAKPYATEEERRGLEMAVEVTEKNAFHCFNHHENFELGKWEGMVIYYRKLPLDKFVALENIDINQDKE